MSGRHPIQRRTVGEVGVAAVDPAGLVVGVQAGGAIAALGAAPTVAHVHDDPLVLGVVPASASHVQRLGGAVEDDGDDPERRVPDARRCIDTTPPEVGEPPAYAAEPGQAARPITRPAV